VIVRFDIGFHVCLCSYARIVARTSLCNNVVLRGCGRLRGVISYFLATRSTRMTVEVANDVKPKYYIDPYSQVCVRDVWVGIVLACILIFVWLRGKIRVGEVRCEVVGNCNVQ